MNLVEDHQLAFVIGKVADGIGQLGPVSLVLQVQIDRRPCFSNLQGKRRFADLSRSEQDHCRGMSEQVIEACAEAS